MSKELLEALSEPFPPEAIKQRTIPGGGRVDYVEGHSVINKINAVTNGVWDFRIVALEWRDTMLLATVEMTIPGLGTRQHIGVQEAKGGGDIVKGAVTDALKKTATLFGVGLHLYGPDYCEEAKPAPVPPPPTDARFNLLNALYEQAVVQGVAELMTAGDYKSISKLAGTICRWTGREVPKSLTPDDILTAIANLALWVDYQRAPITNAAPIAHPEESSPELNGIDEEDNTPPSGADRALFEVPAPSNPTAGNYASGEFKGNDAQPQGRKNARK